MKNAFPPPAGRRWRSSPPRPTKFWFRRPAILKTGLSWSSSTLKFKSLIPRRGILLWINQPHLAIPSAAWPFWGMEPVWQSRCREAIWRALNSITSRRKTRRSRTPKAMTRRPRTIVTTSMTTMMMAMPIATIPIVRAIQPVRISRPTAMTKKMTMTTAIQIAMIRIAPLTLPAPMTVEQRMERQGRIPAIPAFLSCRIKPKGEPLGLLPLMPMPAMKLSISSTPMIPSFFPMTLTPIR